MLIDCDTCVARDIACGDCVVAVLLQSPAQRSAPVEFDDAERAAIGSLAHAGLVPPLRLVPAVTLTARRAGDPAVSASPDASRGIA